MELKRYGTASSEDHAYRMACTRLRQLVARDQQQLGADKQWRIAISYKPHMVPAWSWLVYDALCGGDSHDDNGHYDT